MDNIKSISGKYTSLILPPPHAYEIIFKTTFLKEKINLSLDVTYINREEISIEELEEEGFSGKDDFHWKGDLPSNWNKRLQQLLINKSQPQQHPEGEEIEISVEDDKGRIRNIEANEDWIYFGQELYQASLEGAKIENPLLIKIIELEEKKVQYNIKLSFYQLELVISILENGSATKEQSVGWTLGKKLMEEIFYPDYHPEKATNKTPSGRGVWIDPGEGIWYNMATDVKVGQQPYDKFKITRILKEIIS